MQPEPVFLLNQKGVPPAALPRRLEGLPQPLAVQRVEASQLAVAAHTVNVRSIEHRGAHDRVQSIRPDLTARLPAPHHFGRGPIGRYFEHQGPVVKRCQEEPVSYLPRLCDAQPESNRKRYRPDLLARRGLHGCHPLRMPLHNFLAFSKSAQHWRAITNPLVLQRPPQLPSRLEIERHEERVGLAPHQRHHPFAQHQGTRHHPPDWQLRIELADKFVLPQHPSLRGREAVHVPHRPHGQHLVANHHGCVSWSCRVIDLVFRWILEFPDLLTGLGRHAPDPLDLPLRHAVHHVHPAIRDCRPGITFGNRNRPHPREGLPGGQAVQDSCFTPHQVALWPPPLGPVVPPAIRHAQHAQHAHQQQPARPPQSASTSHLARSFLEIHPVKSGPGCSSAGRFIQGHLRRSVRDHCVGAEHPRGAPVDSHTPALRPQASLAGRAPSVNAIVGQHAAHNQQGRDQQHPSGGPHQYRQQLPLRQPPDQPTNSGGQDQP